MALSRRNTTKYGWRYMQPVRYPQTISLWKTSSDLLGSNPRLAFPRDRRHPAPTSRPRLLRTVLPTLWASQPLP